MNSKNSIDARASGVKPKTDIARCSEAAASSQAQAPEHFRICREIFTHTFLNSWKKTLVANKLPKFLVRNHPKCAGSTSTIFDYFLV